MSEIHGHVCGPAVYELEGVEIEYNPWYNPPTVLRKDGEAKQRLTAHDKAVLDRFYTLAADDKAIEQYRVGGGCQPF